MSSSPSGTIYKMEHQQPHRQAFQAHNPGKQNQELVNHHHVLHHNPQQQQQQQQQQPQHHQVQNIIINSQQTKHQQPQLQEQPSYDNKDEVMQQLMILVRETQDTDNMVQKNRDVYQDFVIQLQTRSRILASISYGECSSHYPSNNHNVDTLKRDLGLIENVLRQKANELNRIRRELLSSQYSIFERLMAIQSKILYQFLPRWHHEQQLLNNGVQGETINLDRIQSWVEKVVDIIWRIKNQIKGLQLTLTDKPNVPFNTEDLENFVVYINKALESLILNAFVVEKQPPQVMKTNTRFTATVRFLCGNKLNVQMINPTVKALILSEQNARAVIRYHKSLIENSWSSHDSASPQSVAADESPPGAGAGPVGQQVMGSQAISMEATPSVVQQHIAFNTNATIQRMNDNPITTATQSNVFGQDQSMTVSDQSPSHQQFFQRPASQHPPQQQYQATAIQAQIYQQRSNQMATSAITNMTTNQHYGSITEIGYNPDIPTSKDFECSGEILNNSNILEYHEASGQMISHFKNMQLKKIKRTEKKGTESVMDEKFILLFFTEFRIADDSFWPYSMKSNTNSSRVKRGDLLFHILAFSSPVVVIVHGNQEPHAWATVTWHNAFATPDEVLYTVPDRVTWRDLGNVLSEKFRSYAGRGLSAHNLRYLASKVYRNRVDSDDVLVTWNQFSKEPMSDKSFTFWEWFHSILKLTKDHLTPLWKAERVFGFIGKKGCVDLLLGSSNNEPCLVGTFLLRFSETELGGVTIAWVANSSELAAMNPTLDDCVQISQRSSPTNTSSNVVMHLQPFISKDLGTRPLADRIRDLKDLVYLYPNIPKDDAFEAYYTPINNVPQRPGENYVKSLLVTTLEKNYLGTNAHNTEVSVTPNSMSQSSPEGFYQDNMNEMMETNYSNYDPCATDFNYTIQ